jgi:hypothetical protein
MSLTDLYTHDVVVYRLSYIADDYGGATSSYVIHLTSYNCRIYQPKTIGGGASIEDVGQIEGVLFQALGSDADIQVGDKFIDGSYEYIVKRVYPVYNKTSENHKQFLLDKIK